MLKYKEEFPEQLLKLMQEGKSLTQVAAEFKINKNTITEWSHTHPEFKAAKELGILLAEAYWEDVGQKGLKGILNKFNPMAWSYYMKCRFKEDWVEANNQKIELIDGVKKLSKEELDKKIDDALKVIIAAKKKTYSSGSGGTFLE